MRAWLLFLLLVPFQSFAFGTHVTELQISSTDEQNYKAKAQKYEFTGAQIQVDGLSWQGASMHTRGSSSIEAPRRSFSIKLPLEVTIENVRSNKIDLLSMWIDKGYLSTHLGFLTSIALNIGRVESQYTEVRINGRTEGLYLAVVKPTASAGDSPYIVRRGYNSKFKFEEASVPKTQTPQQTANFKAAVLKIYSSLQSLSGIQLLNDLRSRMDLTAYMKWMAINSLFKNGDGPDEIYFYADPPSYSQGRIYFRFLPWDFDDLFKAMHPHPINSSMAAKYPDSLLYNYEDKLDLKIFQDPVLYAEFKNVVRSLLEGELNEPSTNAIVDHVKADILPYLDRSDILAMAKYDAYKTPYTKSGILELIELRKRQINERRVWMLERAR